MIISREIIAKHKVFVKHKEYGPFRSLADAISKRNEVLESVGIAFK